mmetsp:Transcript_8804/g.16657  ORF Transcript_8804/g.16657 Transcript_8804/m.16657 type:complete len:243 (-) Transcript_8804:22970-23698(-)
MDVLRSDVRLRGVGSQLRHVGLLHLILLGFRERLLQAVLRFLPLGPHLPQLLGGGEDGVGNGLGLVLGGWPQPLALLVRLVLLRRLGLLLDLVHLLDLGPRLAEVVHERRHLREQLLPRLLLLLDQVGLYLLEVLGALREPLFDALRLLLHALVEVVSHAWVRHEALLHGHTLRLFLLQALLQHTHHLLHLLELRAQVCAIDATGLLQRRHLFDEHVEHALVVQVSHEVVHEIALVIGRLQA